MEKFLKFFKTFHLSAIFQSSRITIEAQVMQCFHVKSGLETEDDLRGKTEAQVSRCLLYRCWLPQESSELQEYENKSQDSATSS